MWIFFYIFNKIQAKYEDGCFLGCSTEKSGTFWPTFQRILLPPSSGRWKDAREYFVVDTGVRWTKSRSRPDYTYGRNDTVISNQTVPARSLPSIARFINFIPLCGTECRLEAVLIVMATVSNCFAWHRPRHTPFTKHLNFSSKQQYHFRITKPLPPAGYIGLHDV
jgi:hypothetical protein